MVLGSSAEQLVDGGQELLVAFLLPDCVFTSLQLVDAGASWRLSPGVALIA